MIQKTRPCLVMLSGHLCSEKLWENQIKAFSDRYHCMPFVFRQGDSIENFALQVLESTPPSFSLAGLSMGGYVAFEIMRKAAHRVERLALLDTSAEADTEERTATRKVDLKAADDLGLNVFAKTLPARWMHPVHAAQESFCNDVVEMVLSVGHTAQKQQQKALMQRIASFETLSKIKCPTLVLCGQQDQATPVSLHEDMARLIADSRLVIVEQCGHLSTMEKPAQVNEALETWLKR